MVVVRVLATRAEHHHSDRSCLGEAAALAVPVAQATLPAVPVEDQQRGWQARQPRFPVRALRAAPQQPVRMVSSAAAVGAVLPPRTPRSLVGPLSTAVPGGGAGGAQSNTGFRTDGGAGGTNQSYTAGGGIAGGVNGSPGATGGTGSSVLRPYCGGGGGGGGASGSGLAGGAGGPWWAGWWWWRGRRGQRRRRRGRRRRRWLCGRDLLVTRSSAILSMMMRIRVSPPYSGKQHLGVYVRPPDLSNTMVPAGHNNITIRSGRLLPM